MITENKKCTQTYFDWNTMQPLLINGIEWMKKRAVLCEHAVKSLHQNNTNYENCVRMHYTLLSNRQFQPIKYRCGHSRAALRQHRTLSFLGSPFLDCRCGLSFALSKNYNRIRIENSIIVNAYGLCSVNTTNTHSPWVARPL